MPARKRTAPPPATPTPAAPPPEPWMARGVPGGKVRLLRDRPGHRLLVSFDPPVPLPPAVQQALRANEFAPEPGEPGVWAKPITSDRLFVESVIAEGVLLYISDAMAAPPAQSKGRGR